MRALLLARKALCGGLFRRAGGVAVAALSLTALVLSAPGVGAMELWPAGSWPDCTAAQANMDPARLGQALDYGRSRGGAGSIARNGCRVGHWGNQAGKHGLYSTTKSLAGSVLLGLALKDRRLTLGTLVDPILPELASTPSTGQTQGWERQITVRHLATHTSGFEKDGGFKAILAQPGSRWLYSDGGANWLADLLTVRYGQDLRTLYVNRVLKPMGLGSTAVSWRDNVYRPNRLRGLPRRELGSGMSMSVDVMARLGLMLLRGGRWKTAQILDSGYVASLNDAAAPGTPLHPAEGTRFGNASAHYGILFWNNADGHMAGVPRDAYWSWGISDAFVLVIPSKAIVAVHGGSDWKDAATISKTLEPFFALVAAAAK